MACLWHIHVISDFSDSMSSHSWWRLISNLREIELGLVTDRI